jgi:hypothetical protein
MKNRRVMMECNDSCPNYFECRYIKKRFNTNMCKYDKSKVDAAHKKELEDREKILKGEK